MAPTRFHWTDDDGSGNVGSVINDAELQRILDYTDAAADAALATVKTPLRVAQGTWTETGAGYMDACPIAGLTLAQTVRIRGTFLLGGSPGSFWLDCQGPGIYFNFKTLFPSAADVAFAFEAALSTVDGTWSVGVLTGGPAGAAGIVNVSAPIAFPWAGAWTIGLGGSVAAGKSIQWNWAIRVT